MTRSEAKDILLTRIGWDNDNTVTGFVLSTANATTDSGLFFQNEHSAITLENIRDCQPVKNISEDDFNEYLEKLRLQCVTQVLNDAFEKDYIDDDLFSLYPSGFDTLISLRMVIIVSELLITTTRSNKVERLTSALVGTLNYDVFRAAPNKFAIRGANYNHTLGIATRYNFELVSVRRRFGNTRNMLKTITKGQAF